MKTLDQDETIAPGNRFPGGWRELDEASFARSSYFSEVPLKRETRQMLSPETSDPAKLLLQYGRPVCMEATLYHYQDETGNAIVSDHLAGKVRFFAFGCDHQFRHLTIEEERQRGLSYPTNLCERCGFVMGRRDSSD